MLALRANYSYQRAASPDMPTRILRDGILSSERIASLGWAEEVFYRRLMSVVDDHGRYYAQPKLLRSACYPLQIDKVSDPDIGKWLTSCVTAGLVRVYAASDAKRYLELLDFGQRKQSKSKFPGPTPEQPGLTLINGGREQTTVVHGGPPLSTVESRLVVGEVGVEDEGVNPLNPPRGDVCDIVVKVYHEVLPRCMRCEALTPKRKKRIQHADKLARQVCKSQEWDYEPEPFWRSYFDECNDDPWLRGDVPNPNNPRWKQNLGVLLAEDRFAEIMDRAIAAMRSAA